MPVTQREIAKRLNLSQSTVAKVLKDSPGVWVSAENRERILCAARDLNYHPNGRFGRYGAVTCAYLTPTSPHVRNAFSIAIDVLAARLGELGYELKVKIFPNQKDLLDALTRLEAKKDSAACVLWGHEAAIEEQGILLERLGIPFVAKGHFEISHPAWPQVDFDHNEMASRVVTTLVELGHRRIAYLGQFDSARYTGILLNGYEDAMQSRGLPVPAHFIAIGDGSLEHGARAMEEWLALPENEQPTAIVMGSGTAPWHGIEKALLKQGRRLGNKPSDIAIIGTSFNDLLLSVGHGMTFKSIMLDELTVALVERLLAPLLQGESIKDPIVRLRPELVPAPSLELPV
ncbi:MAG: LacI family DNA-binding transcriptional regulator [Capsulimonadaceae bacterium]|nr:LacI family DNA-binding transcriptional regulator [Capsulimonadaceae bacterium]